MHCFSGIELCAPESGEIYQRLSNKDIAKIPFCSFEQCSNYKDAMFVYLK